MKKVLAEAIVRLMEEQGHEASIYENYSGRAMLSKETTGIVVGNIGIIMSAIVSDALEESSILRELAENDEMSPLDVNAFSVDNLGFDIIVY
jgi:hypothetical protein